MLETLSIRTIPNPKWKNGWCDAILGIDGCIYWPPLNANRTLKYDPHTDQTSLVGDDFDMNNSNWNTGALATDGIVYCIPRNSNQVLAIDPLGEFLETTKAHMDDHPEKFGLLFQTEADENYALPVQRISL